MEKASHPKFVRWAVLIGIVIALNLFFFAVRTFIIAEPVYEDYCPATRMAPPSTEEACIEAGASWVPTSGDERITKPSGEGWCDMSPLFNECQPRFDKAMKEFGLYTFAIMVGLGVLSLIVGVLPIGSSIVSSGLSYGGVLSLIIASIGYWGDAGNMLRLGISLVALLALLYIGIRRFKD